MVERRATGYCVTVRFFLRGSRQLGILGAKMKGQNELVVVRDFLNRAEAEIAQGALEAEGVHSIVQADDAGREEPGLWMGGVKLLVRPVDLRAANEILGPAR